MKKFTLLLSFLSAFIAGMAATSGGLDHTFGIGGIATTAIGPGGSQIWGMALQNDGNIVVGGFASNGSNMDFAAARYKENGTLDSTFGTNGVVTTAVGDSNDLAFSVALQPDGKILLGGFSWIAGNYEFAVVRYNTDGALDNTFGTNGIVASKIGVGDAKGYSMAVLSDWSIVLGGSAFDGTQNDFALARYKTTGILDSTFGINGTVMTAMGTGDANIYSLSIQSGWSIVVGGYALNGASDNFALARYDLTGNLVNSFGTNGKLLTAIGSDDNGIYALTQQADGRIVATGYTDNGAGNIFALLRCDSMGTLDAGFGTGGKVTTSIGDSANAAYAISMQPDGKIIIAGSIYNGAKQNYAMTRYNTDGSPDNNFGTGGNVVTVMSAGNNISYAVGLQPDGKILSSGYANDGTKDNFSVARYLSGLTLGVIDLSTSQNLALIYPNPVGQNATLEYTLKNTEQLSINLVDMDGRTVETFITNQKQEAGDYKLPMVFPQGLAAGSYMIVISSASGSVTVKIIK